MLKGTVEVLNGNKIQSSVNGTPVVFANDIVVSGSIDLTGTIDGIDLQSLSSSFNNRLGGLETSTGSLNSYTSSNTTNINAIHTATSSLNEFTNSINTTIKSKLNTDGVISGSSQVNITGTTGYSTFSSSLSASIGVIYDNFTTLSASFTETDEDQEDRISVIESRYATTGSNVFKGNQTVTGSLYISQNLIVQGSSSLENITASAVSIGTNKIILNSDTPAIRYAGISVFDSGSTNVTASLFYDSLTNNWKFQHSDVGTDDASILLYGPLGTGIDNAPTLVGNFLTKVEDNGHGHHLTTSSIFDNGSKISLKNNTEITGSLIITSTIVSQGTTLVSGSGQISYAGITNVPSGIVSGAVQVKSLLPTGTVSGSSQVLNGSGVWSGSVQLPSGIVSGSSQVSFNGITDKPTLVSGSSQISYPSLSNIPGGLVSGSSQIDLTATTNYSSGIKTRLNAEGVISGSSQVTGIANSQLTNSSFHVGTTSISLGRTSASQTLTGVSIDGNAATVTNGVYTTGDQSIGGAKTFTGTLTVNTNANQVALFQSPNANTWVDLISTTGTWSMGATSNNTWDLYQRGGVNQTRFSVGASSASLYGNIVLHAGNFTSYAMSGAGFSANQNLNTNSNVTFNSVTGAITSSGSGDNNAPFKFSADYSGWMSLVAGAPGSNNGWGLFWAGNSGAQYGTNGAGGPGNIWANSDNPNEYAFVGNGSTNMAIHGNTGNVWIAGDVTLKKNLTFGSQGSKITFGDSTSGSPSMIGEGLVDTFGSDSDFLTIYARSSFRIFTTNTNERARFDTNGMSINGTIVPGTNNSHNLGSPSLGWANIYTNDLHLSNMNKPEGNDIDGTSGDWTIQEGAENLYIINNRNGKKFKISLEEII
jgi:hypothetical protein